MWSITSVFASVLCTAAIPPGFEHGATLRVFDIGHPMDALVQLVPDQTPNVDRLISSVHLESAEDFGGQEDHFFAQVLGSLWIEQGGTYAFALTSDDGSRLTIDGNRIIDNDGLHSPTSVEGSVELKPGAHPFLIDFFENEVGQALIFEWKPPGGEWQVVPESALLTQAGVTRVTSPGPKRIMGPAGEMKPGSGLPLESVHPAFKVTTIRPDGFEPQVGGLCLGDQGQLYIATFTPNQNGWLDGIRKVSDGIVWVIDNPKLPRERIKVRKVADDLFEPAGIVEYDGKLYVSQRYEITRLDDRDGDGFFETHIPIAKGWVADNYHHFTFGLAARDGYLYATLSTSISMESDEIQKYGYRGLAGPNPPNRGTLIKANITNGDVQYIAGGFRTPNGVGFGPFGEILVADNQGAWNPANSLYAVEPGHFYGHRNMTLPGRLYPNGGYPGPFDDQPRTLPAVSLPQGEISNSPTTPAVIPNGPYKGQLYLGELTAGGIRRVYLEKVNGVEQGCVFRFTQGLEVGVNRLAVADDGTIYIGGTGAGGDWSWRGTQYGLQRLDPVGDYPFEIKSMSAIPGGFRLTFSDPADADQLSDPASYVIQQWYDVPTADYGGPKRELESLHVSSTRPAADARSVELMIPGLEAGRTIYLATRVTSAGGEELWSNETWYSLNQMPSSAEHPAPDMRVLVFSKTAGFRHHSIEAGQAAIKSLAVKYNFDVNTTEDAEYFNDDMLSFYDCVVFLNTTGDVLNDEEQAAFERYIRHGGGFVGIHSATDTEYDWPWYGKLVGAYFKGHPAPQQADVEVIDHKHLATEKLPDRWTRTDEWYNFRAPPKDVHVLARLDVNSYKGSEMDPHPVMWYHAYDGGRAFYTEMGHTDESFREPEYLRQLVGAIYWAAGRDRVPKVD